MGEAGGIPSAEENEIVERTIAEVRAALHDLCQPLTTLQCRLELAEMLGTHDGFAEAVRLGLIECARLSRSVRDMREKVLRMSQILADGQIQNVVLLKLRKS